MSDPTVTAFLTKLLCSHGGRLPRDELAGLQALSPVQLEQILADEAQRFPRVEELVLAQSPVRICSRYLKNDPEEGEDCGRLHLCRYYLQGKCWPGKRPPCTFSHDILTDHNQKVLKENQIRGLNEQEVKVLLLQNDHQLLPEICVKYLHDNCDQENACTRIHACGFYTRGECNRHTCRRSHNLLEVRPELLQRCGMSDANIQNFHMICTLRHKERLQALRAEPRDGRRGAYAGRRGRGRARGRSRSRGVSQTRSQERPTERRGSHVQGRSTSRPASESGESQPYGSGEDDDDDQQETETEKLMKDWFLSETPGSDTQVGASETPCSDTQVGASETPRSDTQVGATGATEAFRYYGGVKRTNFAPTPSADWSSQRPIVPSPLFQRLMMPPPLAQWPIVPPSLSRQPIVPPPLAQRHIVPPPLAQRPIVPPPLAQRPIVPPPLAQRPIVPPPLAQRQIVPPPPSQQSITPPPQSNITSSLPANSTLPTARVEPSLFATINSETGASNNPQPRSNPTSSAISTKDPLGDQPKPQPQSSSLSQQSRSPAPADHPQPPLNRLVPGSSSDSKSVQTPELCLSNIWKYCKLGCRSPEMHFYLPYRWQVFNGSHWEDIPNMESVEKAYCEPATIGIPLVNFETMKSGSRPVRRLSTPSSVTKPDYVLTTEWIWYWKDELDKWTRYGQSNQKNVSAAILSSALEDVYLADPSQVIPFTAGNQQYELNFREMKQKNVVYRTEKDVRRRPRFLSFDDVKMLKGSTKSSGANSPSITLGSPVSTALYPQEWDRSALPEINHQKVPVSETSMEFRDIVAIFTKTLSGQRVQRIWRIQNPSLWQVYQWQKDQMKKANQGAEVAERRLFHGTDSAYTDAICNTNFDWRICGTHGTVYGQGSYFARDASYSHNYSLPNAAGKRSIFLARVLVGEYAPGSSTMKRPPQKPRGTQSYDSCVDNAANPSIYVVFDKLQIYPEYVIEYAEEKKNCAIS